KETASLLWIALIRESKVDVCRHCATEICTRLDRAEFIPAVLASSHPTAQIAMTPLWPARVRRTLRVDNNRIYVIDVNKYTCCGRLAVFLVNCAGDDQRFAGFIDGRDHDPGRRVWRRVHRST